MKQVNCCLCQTRDEESVWRSTDYLTGHVFSVVHCRRCGLRYLNPRPSPKELADYYPQRHQSSEPARYERMDAPPRIRAVQKLVRGKPGRILDVGCGKGLVLARLKTAGWEVFGTESSEVSSRVARSSGVAVFECAVEDCPFEEDSFDVVTMFHVLEHVENPLETLAAVRRILKPEGKLLVEVPNAGSWYAGLFGGDWFHLDVPRHLYHFSPSSLRLMLQRAGFEPAIESTTNVQYDAFGAVQSVLNKLLKPKNLLNNFNTGEVTLGDLWHGERRVRNLLALGFSQAALYAGFPLMALAAMLLRPWTSGGTLRIVAHLAEDRSLPNASAQKERPGVVLAGPSVRR